jgi:alkylhydroperoxidase/carboxymuconolactone decarboxylase family protein YurZ
MTTYNALTREQKLQAEQIVQLGNIAEAIRSAARGEDSSDLQQQTVTLQAEMTSLTANNATLSQQLADANQLVSELQVQINSATAGDITPDSIAEVIAHLNIEVGE